MTDPAHVEALRELPRQLAAAGYHDALAVRGLLTVGTAVAADLEALAPDTAAAVELFFLRRAVARARLQRVLPARSIEALVGLGVLVASGDALSTVDFVLMPVLGRLVLLPSPARARMAYFGDDVAMLLARMIDVPGACLVLGTGAGAIAVHAARRAARVVAVEPDPVAHACAELNLVMNGVDAELRRADLEADVDGRFDHVVVAAPSAPLPVSPERADQTGPAVLARLLGALPSRLAPAGIAQLVGVLHGDAHGPFLPPALARSGLRVMITLAARQSLAAQGAVFEAVARRLAAVRAEEPAAVRSAMARFVAERKISYLYLAAITATPSAAPAVEITRHWQRPGGSWQRRS